MKPLCNQKLARNFSHCLRTLNGNYNFTVFKEDYPILMQPASRPSYYEGLGKDAGWWDKTFLIPLRNFLAEKTTANWINMRFKDTSKDDPFFPSKFLKGAESACKAFFSSLNQELGNEEKTKGHALDDILSPRLYKEFKFHHQKLKDMGLRLDIKLNYLNNVRKGETFMAFGPPDRVTTTLTKAKIYNGQITPMVMWRHSNSPQKWLFHEMTFEYDIDPSLIEIDEDGDVDPPSLITRSETTRQGAVVGIVVFADVNFTLSIIDEEEPTKKWTETIERSMQFRFETEHTSKEFIRSLKIADIDNFFASTLTK